MASLHTYEKWDDIPDHLKTKTSLEKSGLRLAPDQEPVAQIRRWKKRRGQWHEYFYDLYNTSDAQPKRAISNAQQKALKKAQAAAKASWYCTSCGRRLDTRDRKSFGCWRCRDKNEARKWAQQLLNNNDFVVMDTETTGLQGEIIELAIIDSNGNTLMNTRLNPRLTIEPGAIAVHGITNADLVSEPNFPQIYNKLTGILTSAQITIIYNAAFDTERLAFTCSLHHLPKIQYKSECAMEWYAQYYGQWSHYYKSYKWQPLISGDHSALGDCLATLELIKYMAADNE